MVKDNLILNIEDKISMDWRSALRTPPTYRIGNGRITFQMRFVWIFIGIIVVIFLFYNRESKIDTSIYNNINSINGYYNATYPLTKPIVNEHLVTYRIGVISDLDKDSKCGDERKNCWKSFYKKGYISHNRITDELAVSWDVGAPLELTSGFALNGRGMELSELTTFDGRLLSFDDRTGMIYEIVADKAYPWILLMDGDGKKTKGFKSEWATVKDHTLYVGSMGKEWTTASGEFEHKDPQWIKTVSTTGEVKHLSWSNQYNAIAEALGLPLPPGYIIHEALTWSSVHQKWIGLPRRCSADKYNETLDEIRGCNVIVLADEDFRSIKVMPIRSKKDPTLGYSSFKFLPGTKDNIIIALLSYEYNGVTATYITALTMDGRVIMDKQKFADLKYEGLEFI
uniref:Apyrase n=1 Tax=Xenopsylla cheopis TaxID=163159 RepID=A0A6M2DKH0_XENCH